MPEDLETTQPEERPRTATGAQNLGEVSLTIENLRRTLQTLTSSMSIPTHYSSNFIEDDLVSNPTVIDAVLGPPSPRTITYPYYEILASDPPGTVYWNTVLENFVEVQTVNADTPEPQPEPTVTQPDPEPEPTECSNCGELIDDCGCFVCPGRRIYSWNTATYTHNGCTARVYSDEECEHCNLCDTCCTCSRCTARIWRGGACGSREDVCSTCGRCEDSHCECFYCEGCDSRVSDYCGECDRCNDCCECSSVSEVIGTLKFHTADRKQFKLNPFKRHISMEIEVSKGDSHGMHQVLDEYDDSLVTDGSLPDSGWELNLNPSSGDVFLKHIDDICSELSEVGAGISSSCGLHCHVDSRDYGWFDLFKLLKLYGRIEDGLFEIVSPSRRDNRYCIKCTDTYDLPDWKKFQKNLLYRMYGFIPQKPMKRGNICLEYKDGWKGGKKRNSMVFSARTEKYNDNRYTALNVHSFFYRGTIEFRHHNGTIDATKIKNWGMICASIIEQGTKMGLKQIEAVPKGFEGLKSILSPDLAEYAESRRKLFINNYSAS